MAMAMYKVWTHSINGRHLKYEGNDRAAFDAIIAELEEQDYRVHAENTFCWDGHEYSSEIIEETKEEENMNGTCEYLDNVLDMVNSVRVTARTAKGTFTADEMLQALEKVADPAKDNWSLNARRVNATLATLSSGMAGFELIEVSEHVYRVSEVA